jgi:hypothetical protein
MSPPRTSPMKRRGLFLSLAVLALTLRVAVPQGFMLDTHAQTPFPLVICTAGGAVTMDMSDPGPGHDKAPAKSKASDAPCAFAGHGGGLATSDAPAIGPVSYASYDAPALSAVVDLIPGRGLPAPPPPARGPPKSI